MILSKLGSLCRISFWLHELAEGLLIGIGVVNNFAIGALIRRGHLLVQYGPLFTKRQSGGMLTNNRKWALTRRMAVN